MFGRHALNSGKPIRASEHMMLDEDIAETKGQHRVPCLIHVIRVITALSVVQVIMVIMVIGSFRVLQACSHTGFS